MKSFAVTETYSNIGSNKRIGFNGTVATITATGTVTGGTYLWSTGATTASINVHQPQLNILVHLNGCPSRRKGTVTVKPIPMQSTNSSVCNGTAATITATGTATGGYLFMEY
jgi:hypothetical protein